MLQQQGLDEIAHASTSEQIAYLLVERARLLDELEAEQNRNCVDTSEGPMTAEQLLVIFYGSRLVLCVYSTVVELQLSQ